MKIETESGFKCVLDEEALEDLEVFEKLVEIERGNASGLSDVITELIGRDGYENLKEHCRNEKGRVPMRKVSETFGEVLIAARDGGKKN